MNYQQQVDRAYALTEEYLASCFQGEGLEKACDIASWPEESGSALS